MSYSDKGNLGKLALLLSVLLFGVTALGVACADEEVPEEQESTESSIVVTDGNDNQVEFDEHPETVVSMMPHLTETIYAMDLEEQLLGVSDLCNYPQEALDKPQVGDAFNMNVEKIASLEPDVVLMASGEMMPDITEKLTEMGITALTFDPDSIEEIREMYLSLGELFARQEEAAELADDLEAEREELAERRNDLDELPTGVMLLEPESLYTVGEGEFMSEVIELAGVENIADDNSGYYEISQELLLERDPEIIITTYHDIDDLRETGALSELSAVQQERVYQVDEDKFSRPGPRIMEGTREAFEMIHD